MKKEDIILDSYKLITNKVNIDGEKRFFILSDLHIGRRPLLDSKRKVLKKNFRFFKQTRKSRCLHYSR